MEDMPEDEASWWEWLNWKFSSKKYQEEHPEEDPENIKNRRKNKRIERAIEQKKNEVKLWKQAVDAELKRAAVTNSVKNAVKKAVSNFADNLQSGNPSAETIFKHDLSDATSFHGDFYGGWTIPIPNLTPPPDV